MAAENKKQFIRIRGANENNLKNLSVDIPRDKFVVGTSVKAVNPGRMVVTHQRH